MTPSPFLGHGKRDIYHCKYPRKESSFCKSACITQDQASMEKIPTDQPLQEVLSDAPDEAGSLPQPQTKTWKVICLTIALCLGIFCMSLVSEMLLITSACTARDDRRRLTLPRMSQLSPPQFLVSPISLTHWTMWVGMEVPISSPTAPPLSPLANSTHSIPRNGYTYPLYFYSKSVLLSAE